MHLPTESFYIFTFTKVQFLHIVPLVNEKCAGGEGRHWKFKLPVLVGPFSVIQPFIRLVTFNFPWSLDFIWKLT